MKLCLWGPLEIRVPDPAPHTVNINCAKDPERMLLISRFCELTLVAATLRYSTIP